MGIEYLNLDQKYTPEEVARASFRLGASMGGVHGFEFTHDNVTAMLEQIRHEDQQDDNLGWQMETAPMDPDKLLRLEEAGWKIGTIKELLDLTDDDMEIIELRLVCHRVIKALRETIVERDEAKEVIGLLGKQIQTMLKERDEALKERDVLARNYSNAIGPR